MMMGLGSWARVFVADLLCGAGGSSEGCEEALEELDLEMELVCVNHWDVAIETHSRNHPKARHYLQDIATVRPHILVPEGRLDLLMASPTCTHHSVARGGKPTSDQQRSDPWHIITWFTELRVDCAVIENVWEFVKWGPVDPATSRPIKDRAGEYFKAWVNTIWALGATSIEWRKLNAADYGGATTRQRFIMIIRFDGKPIVWPAKTHHKRDADGRVPAGFKPWRAAREIINWRNKGRSILGRPIPLAPKTLARILAGALKFSWPEPFIRLLFRAIDESLKFHLRRAFARRNKKTDKAKWRKQVRDYAARLRHFRVAPREFGKAVSGAEPMLITLRRNADGRSTVHPVPALDTKGGVWLAEPFVLSQHSSGQARPTGEPLPVIMTGGAGAEKHPGCARPMLVEPFIATVAHGNSADDATADSRRSHSVDVPIGAVHGTGISQAVVEPIIVNRNSAPRAEARPVSEPAPAPTCSGGGYLAEPFILSRQGGGAPRSTKEPTPTQAAKHSHILISPYYSSGSGETCTSGEEPLPSPTTHARFGMVMPVTHSDGSNRARDVERDPIPTGTCANRGELALITAQFGERPGQTPRVHDVDEPTPGICATGHINFVEGTVDDGECDILFRMLEPPELAAAMGFVDYHFAGTKTEQVKQIGNAVSVEMMKAIVKALMADRAPKMAAPISEEAA